MLRAVRVIDDRRRRVIRDGKHRKRFQMEPLEDRRMLAVIIVDTLTDELDGSIVDADVSLRDAIALSGTGDMITFDATLDGGTILLTLGELTPVSMVDGQGHSVSSRIRDSDSRCARRSGERSG